MEMYVSNLLTHQRAIDRRYRYHTTSSWLATTGSFSISGLNARMCSRAGL